MLRRTVIGAAGVGAAGAALAPFGFLPTGLRTADAATQPRTGAPLSAEAVRAEPGRMRLSWTNARGAVEVRVSSDPDSARRSMRVLEPRVDAGPLEIALGASPRPYFLVRSGQAEARAAERLLPLQGGRNFRDLGGYRGAGGRQVRWGRIYRSGMTAGLTPGDLAYLRALGLRVVCDLRSAREREREPAPFDPAIGDAIVAAADYEFDASALSRLFAASTTADAVATLAQGYVDTALRLAPQLRDVFARLLRQETPLAFNCSAGKDRTGAAAALILSVLGVSRADVVRDYALSERYVPVEAYLAALRTDAPGLAILGAQERAFFARMPDDVLRVVMGTPAAVMEQMLARLDKDFGGPIGFASRYLGVDAAAVAAMRRIYLT